MKLKINRWTFDVTDNDWVMDNGAVIQCLTLKHDTSWYDNLGAGRTTIMSRKQFNQLVKENKLVLIPKDYLPLKYRYATDVTMYRFNISKGDNKDEN